MVADAYFYHRFEYSVLCVMFEGASALFSVYFVHRQFYCYLS